VTENKASANGQYLNLSYGYDGLDRRTSISEHASSATGGGSVGTTRSFNYDGNSTWSARPIGAGLDDLRVQRQQPPHALQGRRRDRGGD